MAHVKDDGLSLTVLRTSPREEGSPAESPTRPSPTRTPPRVWPPVSPADMGRVVRRLKATAERTRDTEPLEPVLERAAG